MAGIYLHIPFCKQACHYCNFHFSTTRDQQGALIEALAKEIELQKDYLQRQPVHTIYFGGGTPSILPKASLDLLLQTIRQQTGYANEAEITLEANPDDITEENCQAWREAGINRLSIGVQSFIEDELRWMNRAHSAAQSLQGLQTASRFFSNISIDLIYGLPGQSHAQWQSNVEKAISLNIAHLSCYALTVEPKTALEKKIRTKQYSPVDPDKQSAQFLALMEWLEKAGYRHYEISNFAKPQMESRHNSAYWQGEHYVGIGPSAHSYNGISRQWNLSNNALYIRFIEKGQIPYEIEILTPAQICNEYIMTALRTDTGIELATLGKEQERIVRLAERYIQRGHLLSDEKRVWLTKEGKLLADGIAAALFIDN
ncbi:MAG: radical SAM family heme chaperone HemW [Sphingomonadales bacterium]|nr:radical SAM family heme chaperone HemW [Sphingomonadales bacterium]